MEYKKMYVTGIGRTKFGVLKQSIPELIYTAIFGALEDSKLSLSDIEAIYVSNFLGGVLFNQLHLNSVVSGMLPGFNKPVIRVETACASGGSAMYLGLLSLKSFEHVMIVGVEKMSNVNNKEITKALASAGDVLIDQSQGLIFPASYALIAQQHMLRYGTSKEDLSLISIKNHKNAELNVNAHFYYMKTDEEAVKKSPVVCEPLTKYDCCPISDGAVAIIISRKKISKRDVKVVASCLATDSISLSQRNNLTSFKSAKIAAEQAYKIAKITPHDLDIVEVHDCFTIAELIAMEDLGICKPGESKNWIRDGKTTIDGELPINTDGGLIGDGHPVGASGLAQIYEIVTQLRGEAGARQVKKARIGLAHNIGGVGGTAVVHILRK